MNVHRDRHDHDDRADTQAHVYADGHLHAHGIVVGNQAASASVAQPSILLKMQQMDFVVEPSASFVISSS